MAFAERDDECKAQNHELLSETALDPKGLAAYINKNSLNNVEDVICCLPKSYRANFAIAHSSDSAQTSDVARPRVLLFGPKIDRSGDVYPAPLQTVLSFNGGGKDLNKSDNIELAYNNPSRGELEFYDFDFTRSQAVVHGPNPQECLLCHGNQGSLSPGGPKPIFETSDNWTRFVAGIHVCESEKPLAQKIQSVVQNAFRKQSRYRCLDQKIATDDHFTKHGTFIAPELSDLDLLLNQANDRRVAKWLQKTPNYKEFKFAALGSVLCMNVKNDSSDLPMSSHSTLKYWVPDKVLEAMIDTSSISSDLRSGAQPIVSLGKLLAESARFGLQIEAQQKLIINKLDAGIASRADFYRGPLGCFEEPEKAVNDVASTLTGDKILDLYKIDSALKAFRSRPFNPFFRYLFEARGISLGNVSQDAVNGVYLPLSRNIVNALLDLEPKGSVLYKAGLSLRKVGITTSLYPSAAEFQEMKNAGSVTEDERFKVLSKACAQLKQYSYSSLSLIRVADIKKAQQPQRLPAKTK